MDDSAFSKIFSAAAGVWALVAMASVALFRAWPLIMARLNERRRDNAAEKAGDWDRIRSERDVAREECDLVRDRWAECERISNERLGRAVIAEATLIARDKEAGRPTFLPGGEELERKPGGGNDDR